MFTSMSKINMSTIALLGCTFVFYSQNTSKFQHKLTKELSILTQMAGDQKTCTLNYGCYLHVDVILTFLTIQIVLYAFCPH